MLGLAFGLPIRPDAVGMVQSEGGYQHVEQRVPLYELLFVREGTLHMHVENVKYDVHKGEVLLVWPNELYGGTRPGSGRLKFYFLHFDISQMKARKIDSPLRLMRKTTVLRPDRLVAIIHLMLDDQMGGVLASDSPASKLIFAQILAEVGDFGKTEVLPATSDNVLMQRGKAYIRRHVNQSMSTSGIAEALEVSPRYFGKVFRRAAGYSVREFIAMSRFHNARNLVIEGDLSLKQIAQVCGFADYAYFSRAFHKHEGMSPRTYRRMHSRAYAF